MQFGKSLIGAIIGGVLGIAVIILIHSLTGWDKYWLAILVAIFTGLGVRWMVATTGHPSYARGALTALVAMAAFFAFFPIMAQLRTREVSKPVNIVRQQEQPQEQPEDDGAGEGAVAEPVRMEERPVARDTGLRNARPQEISPWDIISLCLAAFIAYELGRGSGGPRPAVETTPRDDEVPPVAVGQTAAPPD